MPDVRFFRAEIDERIVAVARLDDAGRAFRLGRNCQTWMRVSELDRLRQLVPADALFWAEVDEGTASSSVAELVGTPTWPRDPVSA